MERLLLRPAEAAELLGISRSKTYEMLAAGELPSIRVRSSIRVPHQALVRWTEEHATTSREGLTSGDLDGWSESQSAPERQAPKKLSLDKRHV
jgi:excisionase family DNA binding protein